jgi:hypothetical protein
MPSNGSPKRWPELSSEETSYENTNLIG